MKAFSITDVGQKRHVNQDYVFCSETAIGEFPNLFLVADGMGGHNAGDYASRFCVEEFIKRIQNSKEKTYIGKIETAITQTNEALLEQARRHPEFEGMGTTFVFASIIESILYIANIGDSRLYLLRETIHQITEDHSLVEQMVRKGELLREEARFHPNKNVITRALGGTNLVNADYFEVPIITGDMVLMCSDGLSNMLDDTEIFQIVTEYKEDLKTAGEQLVSRANENGGKDNISIILIAYGDN